MLPQHYSLQPCGLSCPWLAHAPPSLHAVKETEPGDNSKKLFGNQSPVTVRQPQTTVIIFHPKQALVFDGDIGRRVIILQNFRQENTEQGLLSNSYLPTLSKHMKSPQQAQKKKKKKSLYVQSRKLSLRNSPSGLIIKKRKKNKQTNQNQNQPTSQKNPIPTLNWSYLIKYIFYSPAGK